MIISQPGPLVICLRVRFSVCRIIVISAVPGSAVVFSLMIRASFLAEDFDTFGDEYHQIMMIKDTVAIRIMGIV